MADDDGAREDIPRERRGAGAFRVARRRSTATQTARLPLASTTCHATHRSSPWMALPPVGSVSGHLDRFDDDGSAAVEFRLAQTAQHGVGRTRQDVALDRVAVGIVLRFGIDDQVEDIAVVGLEPDRPG